MVAAVTVGELIVSLSCQPCVKEVGLPLHAGLGIRTQVSVPGSSAALLGVPPLPWAVVSQLPACQCTCDPEAFAGSSFTRDHNYLAVLPPLPSFAV